MTRLIFLCSNCFSYLKEWFSANTSAKVILMFVLILTGGGSEGPSMDKHTAPQKQYQDGYKDRKTICHRLLVIYMAFVAIFEMINL